MKRREEKNSYILFYFVRINELTKKVIYKYTEDYFAHIANMDLVRTT